MPPRAAVERDAEGVRRSICRQGVRDPRHRHRGRRGGPGDGHGDGSLARAPEAACDAVGTRYLYEKAKTIDRFGTGTEGTDMSATCTWPRPLALRPRIDGRYVAGSRALPKGVTWASMDEEAAKLPRRDMFPPRRLRRYRRPARSGPPCPRHDRRDQRLVHRRGLQDRIIKPTEQDTDVGGSVIAIVRFDPADGSIGFAHSWGVSWETTASAS